MIANIKKILSYSLKPLQKRVTNSSKSDAEVSIKIPFEKKFVSIARAGLSNIITDYVPTLNKKELKKIHSDIMHYFTSGLRADSLSKELNQNNSITKEIAQKIAAHSLSFLYAKYHQARYQSMGINKYRWSTCNDERVRQDHKVLQGKIFEWEAPPIADTRSNKRYNPGEALDCRCIAVPVIE